MPDLRRIRLADSRLGDDELAAAAAVMRSGWLVQGPSVESFEGRVGERLGAHAVAVSSGTAALHLAALALRLGPGDEVIVPDFTFPAVANAVEATGARAVLVDVRADTRNLDVDGVSRAVTERTRAVIAVHQFGIPADLAPLELLVQERGLALIEDAACALGARYRGQPCGRFGDVACLSFHPRKIITTGEGGMLVTRDPAIASLLRSLRNHGQIARERGPEFVRVGLNYRMTDFQAAIGVVQLGRLDERLARAAQLAAEYDVLLRGVPGLRLPTCPNDSEPCWQSYFVVLPPGVERAPLRAQLLERGIETSVGAYSLSAQPCYAGRAPALPVSRELHERGLCIPLHPGMSLADVRLVAQEFSKVLESVGSTQA